MKTLKFLFFLSGWTLLFSCKKEEKQIVILKWTTHSALNELEDAYVKTLNNLILNDASLKNQNYSIKKFNANADKESAKTIASSFTLQKKVKLITGIGTPASIEIAQTVSNIPFLYGAVADPKGSQIIPSDRATGIQNAGESIVIEALSLIKKAFPNAKKIGTLYNPTEANSLYVQEFIKKNCKRFGFELIQSTVNNNSQLVGVTEYLCNNTDVIYSANDNIVNAGIESIIGVTNKKGKPFIIGDLSTLSKGPLFAIGLQYKAMGDSLAYMAYSILKGKSIKSIPPQSAPKSQIWLNKKTQSLLKYTLTNDAKIVVNKIIE